MKHKDPYNEVEEKCGNCLRFFKRSNMKQETLFDGEDYNDFQYICFHCAKKVLTKQR